MNMRASSINFFWIPLTKKVNTLILFLIIGNTFLVTGQSTGRAPPPAANQTNTNGAPTSASEGKTLRIAVPVSTYKEFVSITKDNLTGEQIIRGFSVEVFKAVVNTALSNSFLYTLVPFAKSDGSFNGSFDAMLQAVFDQEYDGAVGDTTIRYDRSQWVDFTLPYSDTGITMMISTNQPSNRKTGIKLMPLIKGLVSAALVFCFVSALIFWFLEFRNDKRRQSQQAPISSRTPGQRANADDFWRTSFTSLMRAQRQRTPIRTLDELIRNRAKIGNQKGSFVPRLLIKRGFSEDQIMIYDTEQQIVDMLSKGIDQGGVSAIIDETPYLKVFLSKNCNKGYTLVPSFDLHAEGFGFAFQKGSPLVQEISNGILKLMDDDQLATIQHRTIGNFESCEDDPDAANVDNNLLDYDTLWILFAGAIGVSILVIILYMVYFGTSCHTIRKLAYPCYLLPNYQERKN
ncbi:glutamate receptor 2.5-like isoform X2 [Amaranthus tricolor]|uniref:glutamate receptor 2.5-like isoform X2 n=1 Tax=Amaranthus tricolor TaxID=29722 RepID=UPI002587ADB0|nr:glutamate receptor 2.5-like isoform X2 [Amaranthus tricolor]